MMRKAMLFLFFFSVFASYAQAVQEYSLEDLYNLALEKNESIKISEEDVYISERDKDRAMAVLIPTFSAFGSHTEYDETAVGIQPERSSSWGLKVSQSLSMSGRELTALTIAKESIVKSGLNLSSVKEEYLLGVAFDYFNLLKARKALDIAFANVERLTKYRDAAQTRLKVGEITKTVLLRAEAELSGAQSELISADNSLKLAKAVLARTAGITGEYDLKESTEGIYTESLPHAKCLVLTDGNQITAIDCLKQIALSERQELKAAELERLIAEKQITYTKGTYWPDISLEGGYTRREDSPTDIFPNKESTYGLIRIDYPFFEGGLRKAEVRQSEARFRQAELRMNDLENTINIEIQNAYHNLNTVSGILDSLEAEVAYARDNYNSVTKQFEFGLADSLDVMDANNLLVTSERKLANAQYDKELAIVQLQRATGTLLETITRSQESGDLNKNAE